LQSARTRLTNQAHGAGGTAAAASRWPPELIDGCVANGTHQLCQAIGIAAVDRLLRNVQLPQTLAVPEVPMTDGDDQQLRRREQLKRPPSRAWKNRLTSVVVETISPDAPAQDGLKAVTSICSTSPSCNTGRYPYRRRTGSATSVWCSGLREPSTFGADHVHLVADVSGPGVHRHRRSTRA